ncbi:MAG TPA: response regulator [Thermoanaerobaculia bacterium]|jgi:CheY-like chemotaxis protein|nr:response regulator [Thermoanaerobaculia bacterium]
MPSRHVLIVEDDDFVRHLLIEYLREHFLLEVDSARDGADAFHYIKQRHYDVVVLDVMMPYMTGIDFLDSLQALHADPTSRTLKELPAVIVLTGASVEQIPHGQIEERFPILVRAVLRKPVQTEQLQWAVGRWLGAEEGAGES